MRRPSLTAIRSVLLSTASWRVIGEIHFAEALAITERQLLGRAA